MDSKMLILVTLMAHQNLKIYSIFLTTRNRNNSNTILPHYFSLLLSMSYLVMVPGDYFILFLHFLTPSVMNSPHFMAREKHGIVYLEILLLVMSNVELMV